MGEKSVLNTGHSASIFTLNKKTSPLFETIGVLSHNHEALQPKTQGLKSRRRKSPKIPFTVLKRGRYQNLWQNYTDLAP
jgi:hypothetical protein